MTAEPHRLTYAIGDIHGRLDLLTQALARIEAHAGARGADIVCLGDYVDRGPDSKGVVERLMAGPSRPGDTLTCLKGNHEVIMLEVVGGDERRAELWDRLGGIQTMASYGGVVPPAHLDWLANRPLTHRTPHRIYVHAGLRPGVAVEDQVEADMLWIRDLFLEGDHDFGPHVVHGHTPRDEHKRKAHRTNLDTGACWTGVLSVGVFDEALPGGPVEVLTIEGPPGEDF